MYKPIITITYGEVAENHVGMQKIGNISDNGFSINDLKKAKKVFKEKGYSVKLYKLNNALPKKIKVEKACILVVKNGVDCLLEGSSKTSIDLLKEQLNLNWDKKAKMYGRVVNKKARYNLCYDNIDQKPNYEQGKGRIISWKKVPLTKFIRDKLPEYINGSDNLKAEGNLYYDKRKCGIGMHGDAERKKVIAIRLGSSLPIFYQWYHQSEQIGKKIKINLKGGDLYIMSEKASGHDWKKKSLYTLRHATGCKKFTG